MYICEFITYFITALRDAFKIDRSSVLLPSAGW